MTYRRLSYLLLLAVLAGCDKPAPPAPLAAPPAPPAASEPAAKVQPEPATPKPVVEAPVVKPPKPAPAKAEKAVQLKPKVTVKPPPPVKLDLSLPDELVEAVEPGQALVLDPLLPALFGREIESDFRLNGRLIDSPEQDRMFDGAELKIEIRR